MKEKICNIMASNRINYVDLESINNLWMEEVYKRADNILYKIVVDELHYGKDKEKNKEKNKGKDEQSLNVISFLGGRGRGKSSSMLSFAFYINKLQNKCEWSKFYKDNSELEKIEFVVLPYIDAAMLAEQEYIFDVVLAKMWDEFEELIKDNSYQDSRHELTKKEIRQKFIDIRKAYQELKERDIENGGIGDKDMPAASALHELAASMNLRQKMEELVEQYLEFFAENISKKMAYLVILIDDIDMSGQKAHHILEQIRRFLRIPKVIVFITSDIDRLQLACEYRYIKIYKDDDLHRYINEYLEKVLPYNMRVYMPEIIGQNDEVIINLDEVIKEELKLKNKTEKDMILEFLARECEMYFDGTRRKRHFLQNHTLRSMANYFEQMMQARNLGYYPWLKADLEERLAERVLNREQKSFIKNLFFQNYEDVNEIIINYVNKELFEYNMLEVGDTGLGQVLYACSLLEDGDLENKVFINYILMYYTIMLFHLKNNEILKERILGDSVWGGWEYGAVYQNSNTMMCQGFQNKGTLKIVINDLLLRDIKNKKLTEIIKKIIDNNKEDIEAWLYTMLFIKVEPEIIEIGKTITDISVKVTKKDDFEDIFEKDIFEEDIFEEDDFEEDIFEERILEVLLEIQPRGRAIKNYFSVVYEKKEKLFEMIELLLRANMSALVKWICEKREEQIDNIEIDNISRKETNYILQNIRIFENNQNDEEIEKLQSPEIVYSIGKELETVQFARNNTKQELYQVLVLKYQKIEKKLKEIDDYYKKIGIENTNLQNTFSNSIQAKLLLGKIELSNSVKKKFVNRLGYMLYEVQTFISSPDR